MSRAGSRRAGRGALRRGTGRPGPVLLGSVLLAGGALVGGCGEASGGAVASGAATVRADTLAPIPDSAFARMVVELSEPEQYFDTDNLISNEASYLHVVDALERRGVSGGAYLGVGPAQNFSYVAAVRPSLAFMVDIRRDNLLQHLWYKALFERSESRLDYLCTLVGRACGGEAAGLSVSALVERVEASPRVDTLDALIAGIIEEARSYGAPGSPEDSAYLASVHRRFADAGLDLRFNTHGRRPQSEYPTLRELLLERDRTGRPANYLADPADYAFVRSLQRRNRVIPVVADLGGSRALAAIGQELERRSETVSAFYTSNVEFYLFGDGSFPAFVANLGTLPIDDDAVIIRSYFNRFRPIPQTVPGYASTQLLHGIQDLLRAWEEGRVRRYSDLLVLSESADR